MAVFNGAFPILPGKEDAARAFAAGCLGDRKSGFEAAQARTGATRETWTVQQTPMGAFMLVWFETDDVEAAFVDLATSQEEFTVWMRGQILDCTGVDMSVPDGSPPPEVVLDWHK
jgi:hypothetical protein